MGCVQAEKKEVLAAAIPRQAMAFIIGSHLDENSWFETIQRLGSGNTDKYDIVALPKLNRDGETALHLEQIAEHYCEKLTAPTTLVAHSFGGAISAAMMGLCPEKISKIIYVAAIVPLNGEKAMDLMKNVDQKLFMSAVKIEKGRIIPKSQKKLLSVLDAGINLNSLILPDTYSESMFPGKDVIRFDVKKFEKTPKYYIFTEADKIIPRAQQKKYSERVHVLDSKSVTSGHLPMISQPAELALAIDAFASIR